MPRVSGRRLVLPWVVWGVAVLAQMAAIAHRSSLAALGPAAQRHFDVDATTLSMFAVVQLVMVAALQVPVGVLLDRFGLSVMIISGSLVMAVGQVTMAVAPDVIWALVARAFVGAGDACVFVSIIRLLPEWFSLRQIPVVTQLTGLLGQLGQIVSVAPFAVGVSVFGWATGFLGLAGLGVVVSVLCFLVLRDHPGRGTALERVLGATSRITSGARSYASVETAHMLGSVSPPATDLIVTVGADGAPTPGSARVPGRIRDLLRLPRLRLAIWLLFTPMFPLTTMFMLWGTPFFTGGLGYSAATSASLLSLAVVVGMCAGVCLGPIVARFRAARIGIVLGISLAVMIAWLVMMLWPGQPPFWVAILLVAVTPLGGPAGTIGFDEARLAAPRSYLGLATALVNMAAFVSPLLAMLLIGLVLDLQGAGSPSTYSLEAFRLALLMQVPIWLVGLTGIVVEWRRAERAPAPRRSVALSQDC